jgi:hypothetical protein
MELCLPIDLEESITPMNYVLVVNSAVNRLDDTIFDAAYPAVAATAITKVIIYIYTKRMHSSRQIAKALWEYRSRSCDLPDGSVRISTTLTASFRNGRKMSLNRHSLTPSNFWRMKIHLLGPLLSGQHED